MSHTYCYCRACLKDNSTVRWFILHHYIKNVSCTNQGTVALQQIVNLYIEKKNATFGFVDFPLVKGLLKVTNLPCS